MATVWNWRSIYVFYRLNDDYGHNVEMYFLLSIKNIFEYADEHGYNTEVLIEIGQLGFLIAEIAEKLGFAI